MSDPLGKPPLQAPDPLRAGYKPNGQWWHNPVTGEGGWDTLTREGDITDYREHLNDGSPAQGWRYNKTTGQSEKYQTGGKTNR